MSTFPRNHPVRDYVISHMGKCHCAPYLFSVWNHYNQEFVQLDNIINLPVYDEDLGQGVTDDENKDKGDPIH